MAFEPISFIEENLVDDADFMNLYHRLDKTVKDDVNWIKDWIWPILHDLENANSNYTDEYKVAYVKYRMFLDICEELVVKKLGATPTRKSKPTDVIIKDLDSNLWSTFDKKESMSGGFGWAYFMFKNYTNKVITVRLAFAPLNPDNPEFLYKLPLLEQKVHLYRIDINNRLKDLGLIRIKDITKANIKAWAEGY